MIADPSDLSLLWLLVPLLFAPAFLAPKLGLTFFAWGLRDRSSLIRAVIAAIFDACAPAVAIGFGLVVIRLARGLEFGDLRFQALLLMLLIALAAVANGLIYRHVEEAADSEPSRVPGPVARGVILGSVAGGVFVVLWIGFGSLL